MKLSFLSAIPDYAHAIAGFVFSRQARYLHFMDFRLKLMTMGGGSVTLFDQESGMAPMPRH